MARLLRVESCGMCSNRNRFNDECMAVNPRRRPDDFDSVPDWCPLEEDRWIPVGERLPEEWRQYLVVVMFEGSRMVYIGAQRHGTWYATHLGKVTHYRALPPLPEANGWIPVGERLPEAGESVLTVVRHGDHARITVSERSAILPGADWLGDGGGWVTTHWQSLPALPEEVTDDA